MKKKKFYLRLKMIEVEVAEIVYNFSERDIIYFRPIINTINNSINFNNILLFQKNI